MPDYRIEQYKKREWAALKAWIAANIEIVIKATVPSAGPGRIESGPVIAKGVTEFYFGEDPVTFAGEKLAGFGISGAVGGGLAGLLVAGMTRIGKKAAKPTLKAAFKLKDGRVINVGEIHILPDPLTTADIAKDGSGFVDIATGKFYTRDEALALTGKGTSEAMFTEKQYKASAQKHFDEDMQLRAERILSEYGPETPQAPGNLIFPGKSQKEGIMGLDIPDLVRYLNDPNVKGKLRKMMQQEVLSKKAAQVKEFASWIDDVHAKLRGKAFLSEADFESIVNDLEKAYNAGIIDRNQFVGYTREFQSALRETPLPEPTAKTAKIYDVDDPIYKSKEGKEWAGIFDPTATASRYGKEISEAEFLDIVNALQKAREGGFITSSYAAKLTRYWQQRTRFPKKLKPGEKLDPFGRKVEAADPSKKPPEVDMEAWGGDLEEWQLSKQTSKKEWKKAQYKYDNPKTGSYITQLTIGGAALAGYGIYKGGEQIKKFITNLLLNYMNSTIGMGEVNWVIDPEDKSVPDQPRQKKQESYPGDQSFERLMRRAQVSAAQLSPSVSAIQRREDDSEDDEDYSEAILEAAFMSIGRLGISSAKSTQDSISALRLARISSAKLSNEARASLNRQSRLASTEARRGAREHDRVVKTVARERQKVETTQRQAGRYLGARAGRLLFEVLDGQKEPFAKAWQLCGQVFVSTVVESIYGTFEDAALDWLDRITGLSKVLEKIAKALEKFMAQVLGNDDDSGGIEGFGGSVPAHRGMAPQVRPSSSSPSSLARRIDSDGSGPIVVQVVLPEHLCLDHQALAQNLAFSMQRYAHRWN